MPTRNLDLPDPDGEANPARVPVLRGPASNLDLPDPDGEANRDGEPPCEPPADRLGRSLTFPSLARATPSK
jgi:hypothetical protein